MIPFWNFSNSLCKFTSTVCTTIVYAGELEKDCDRGDSDPDKNSTEGGVHITDIDAVSTLPGQILDLDKLGFDDDYVVDESVETPWELVPLYAHESA